MRELRRAAMTRAQRTRHLTASPSRQRLEERAAALGRGLKYRYDGLAQHMAFRGNEHQWALIHNWAVQPFKTLRDVAAELDRLEADRLSQTVI